MEDYLKAILITGETAMEELQIWDLNAQLYINNGLYQVAVIIGFFIAFRVARFSQGAPIFAKVLGTLFGLMITFFSLQIGAFRTLIDQSTAILLAEAEAAGASLTAQAKSAIALQSAEPGMVATLNLFSDIPTIAISAIVLIMVLGTIWGPKINFNES